MPRLTLNRNPSIATLFVAVLALLLIACERAPEPVAGIAATPISDTVFDLTIREGRYHQVKRMVAAVGNRVESLCRIAVGGLELPADLAPGEWKWLEADDLEKVWRGCGDE